MSKGISWTKKNWRKKFQIFFTFHRGDPYEFSRRFFWYFLKKNHKGPPMKSVKNLKNINTILNAPYPYVLKLKPPAPFSRKFITTYMELSSMPFWRKYKDPPTFMKCGINILKILRKLPIVRPFNCEEITQCIDT